MGKLTPIANRSARPCIRGESAPATTPPLGVYVPLRVLAGPLSKAPYDKSTCEVEPDPIILQSAYRHGVTDAQMLHALRFPIRLFVQDDSMVMFIGPDETSILVEVVGVIEWPGIIAIAHAIRPARTKYLR